MELSRSFPNPRPHHQHSTTFFDHHVLHPTLCCRFVTHIDDAAIAALTGFYAQVFPPSGKQDAALLDMCSSWISHYPTGYSAGRIAGLGMNKAELERNSVLTDFAVKDLNTDPVLPYEDNSFDVITNAVSVDYLNRPREVFKEMHRVLKPGGMAVRQCPVTAMGGAIFPGMTQTTPVKGLHHCPGLSSLYHASKPLKRPAFPCRCLMLLVSPPSPPRAQIMSFSNRCFPTKAIALWTATGDLDHVWIVGRCALQPTGRKPSFSQCLALPAEQTHTATI